MFRSLIHILAACGVVVPTLFLTGGQSSGGCEAAEPVADSTETVVQANTTFAIDLYKQLAKDNPGENLFFSPYSVSSALSMTAEGARRETALQMGEVLGFPDSIRRRDDQARETPWDMSAIHAGLAAINRKLGGADDPAKQQQTAAIQKQIADLRAELDANKRKLQQAEASRNWREMMKVQQEERQLVEKLNNLASQVDQYEIRVANALWGEKTYPLDPNFVRTINTFYGTGGVFSVDFRNAYESVRVEINTWVEDQTNDRIKNLIPEGALGRLTRLVLVNAIYFKGEWDTPFEESSTKDRDFTLADGETVTAPIMYAPELDVARYGAFNGDGSSFNTPMRIRHGQDPKSLYPAADGFAVVELPYKGDDLSMVVIVPRDPAGLSAVETMLTPENLDGWIEKLRVRKTNVHLPKFKMETKYTLGDSDGTGSLQQLGMVRAFKDPVNPATGAQFPGMTTSTDPMDQLYISKVFHKAFVEVNEQGTEAAAATAVVMFGATSMPVDVPFTPEIKADRPFLFLIREKSTGSVLFLGRMMTPK